ncbi:ATP-binding protein [Thiorhodococcus minor]|uniref:ATP-binding protein n=1 Tax=Thiorhodococcus minor TaxID=57489 RepID=A0A6M0K576_9GAMM|nr:ATP-binding protein [Thiorhodococcus minor]NEV63747.1 ATP-binding protein [Thiorhodococcus minor]
MTNQQDRQGQDSLGEARASPTKDFFVRMLTRDIELGDALLDLLDNCLDGVLRTGSIDRDSRRPYEGYKAKLILSEQEFVIEDNCGGIPLDVARRYAFAMGRPQDAPSDAPATIGMYGIGMKRAIFKMGTNAIVQSRHGDDEAFYVEFTPEWMADDIWEDLEIYSLDESEFTGLGTRIQILKLGDEARRFFGDRQKVDDFRKLVARHYSLILEKGFEVRIGSPDEIDSDIARVRPAPFRLLWSTESSDSAQIAPFVYRGQIEGVDCEIYAGFYRPLLTKEELETEEESRGSTDDAGWVVVCNDRVVIWKDRTRLTGWGESGVPNFHGQFIPITGIVLLYSEDPSLLPLTTTKRGIDAASSVYSVAKDMMRDATKELTKFTNRWKKFPEERNEFYKRSSKCSLTDIRNKVRSEALPLRKTRRFGEIQVFRPDLPAPPRENTDARISFLANKEEIEIVRRFFFEDQELKNEEVGKRSFAYALEGARRASE